MNQLVFTSVAGLAAIFAPLVSVYGADAAVALPAVVEENVTRVR